MRLMPVPKYLLAAMILAAAVPLSAQSSPSAVRGGWPLIVGGGISFFNPDFPGESGMMEGPTLWADWTRIPFAPRRLGVEGEWRKINWNAPSGFSQLRSNTFLGGPTYTWTFNRTAVYGKGLAGFGAMDFPSFGAYSHDTRTIWALGGGAQYRIWNGVWVRGDYEHQWWPTLFGSGIKPQGFSISVAYDFRASHGSL